MSRFGLYWRTIRHLQWRQLVYQIINRFRKPDRLRLPKHRPVGYPLCVSDANKPQTYQRNTFTFLNQSVTFPQTIDWNYAEHGKLWTYNLNYFDFLHQPDMTVSEGYRLIRQFIDQSATLRDGLEPYPTSLRIVNWVTFLSRYTIQDELIRSYLWAQADWLNRRLEYHLAGNHLLENGFALLMAGLYFRNKEWAERASNLIFEELTGQVLADGAHDERSPMYHQILLDHLLDVLIAVRSDSWYTDWLFATFLSEKASQMRAWLESITFSNGAIPMVNDSSPGVAPTTKQILKKAAQIDTLPASFTRAASGERSGYRLFRQGRYELFTDVGMIGPDHQPGHAHADTFSFLLYVDGQPVIVDSGTSTYQLSERRQWERSTAAHNTVCVNGENSSEVWGGFRVGRRARVTILENTDFMLRARHDGYRQSGIIHERQWSIYASEIRVLDRLLGTRNVAAIARLYFHPSLSVCLVDNQVVAGPITLVFTSATLPAVSIKSYEMATGFNELCTGQYLEITVDEFLNTTITINK